MHRRSFLFFGLLLILSGCFARGVNAPDPVDVLAARQIPAGLRGDVTALVDGNTQFACDMYARLAADSPGNLFFSPFSISTALSMVHAGARGPTSRPPPIRRWRPPVTRHCRSMLP